ncbi:M13 family metallopeptidase [Arcanobacterium urinimassiliense]|uniref:M13 family metallopeptidase n=1 Tax=Arcanobacterium urinimassiliense TaxID=1871014 RepID=UPI00093CF73D|nr:M13-type metalloendopeptidase [Arcanobacterium urinimassiliense]
MTIKDSENYGAKVISELDTRIRPQDDLFGFVNGKWLESTSIPADQAAAGAFIDLREESLAQVREIVESFTANPRHSSEQKVADLYASFMDEARIEEQGIRPLEKDLALIRAAKDKDNLGIAVGQLLESGVSVPFSCTVDADRNQPDAYIVWISQDGLGLPDESFYRDAAYAPILQAYKEFLPQLYALGTGISAEAAADAAQRILDFETALASHHYDVVKLRDAEQTNNVLSWEEFQSTTPGFNWEDTLEVCGITAQNAPKLLVYTPGALQGFAQLWQDTPLDTLQEYLVWQTILARAPYLSTALVEAQFNFYGKVLAGKEKMRPRWKRGIDLVDGILGEAIGKEYVARHFPPTAKTQMEQLVADLLAAYRTSIQNLEWMGEDTRQKALQKLDSFVTKIGYPEKWKDYQQLHITSGDLVENMRQANKFFTAYEVGKLGKPVDRDEWFMHPQTVNAYYNPLANEIVFPAAILQPPFFSPDADPAWNYGGIGAVIGHEIGHGFDDQGSKYDGSGRLHNWWSEHDRAEFEKRTGALVKQYNSYVPAQFPADSPHHVNGELTLGENIGDLGGLGIALRAYDIAMRRAGYTGAAESPIEEGYSGLQRVFLSYARAWQEKRRDELMVQRIATDPHAPAEFRCNGVVKNIDAFVEAFDVQEGDELYLPPQERVQIW